MTDRPAERGEHAPGAIPAARAALGAWVDAAGDAGRTFLQVRLRATAAGRYEIRHNDDAGAAPERVERDPFAARAIAQTTAAGEHRPLKTSPNLRRGWLLAELDLRGLWTALDYLYPACALHWYAGGAGTLRITPWADTAGRQSGIYSPVRLLPGDAVRHAVQACCGSEVCLRTVAWTADPPPEPSPGDAVVPCPEACSMFVAFARQVLKTERAPRREVPGLVPLGAEEMLQLRAVVAGAARGTLGTVREGEFDDPLNARRVRYLDARLAGAQADVAVDEACEGCPRAIPCAGCPMVDRPAA